MARRATGPSGNLQHRSHECTHRSLSLSFAAMAKLMLQRHRQQTAATSGFAWQTAGLSCCPQPLVLGDCKNHKKNEKGNPMTSGLIRVLQRLHVRRYALYSDFSRAGGLHPCITGAKKPWLCRPYSTRLRETSKRSASRSACCLPSVPCRHRPYTNAHAAQGSMA